MGGIYRTTGSGRKRSRPPYGFQVVAQSPYFI